MTLIDVTNPMKPKKLVEGFGDFTDTNGKSQTHANQVHSAFGWVNDGDRPRLRDHDRRRGGHGHRHHRDHEPEPAEVGRRLRPHPAVRAAARRGPRRRRLHPRRGRQEDQRPLHRAAVVLGRRLHQVRRHRPGERRRSSRDTDYAAVRPGAPRLRRSRSRPRATATRPSSRATTSCSSPPTRTSTRTASRATITTGRSPATSSRRSRAPTCRSSTPTRRWSATRAPSGWRATRATIPAADATHNDRGHRARRVRLHGQGADSSRRPATTARSSSTAPGVDGCETLVTHARRGRTSRPCSCRRTDGFRILGASLDGYTCSEATDAAARRRRRPARTARTSNISAVFDGWGYVHLFDAEHDGRPRPVLHPRVAGPGVRRGLRRPVGARGGDRSRRGSRVHLVLLRRPAGAEVPRRGRATPTSRRSARTSTRTATTSGASRCTSTPTARSTCSPPTATPASGSSSTPAADRAGRPSPRLASSQRMSLRARRDPRRCRPASAGDLSSPNS